MGRKIFVSYKYADDQVKNTVLFQNSTVRDYVNIFESKLENSDNIFKGEKDNEDLSDLSDDKIWEKLKDRIFDSSVTVLFISPEMKESGKRDRDQWIPWEISYSLQETHRKDKNGNSVGSYSNAIVAVVLPDTNGSYLYYWEPNTCCPSGCITHRTDRLFKILKENKFNIKESNMRKCNNGDMIWRGESSYIKAVKWEDFINNYSFYIEQAVERRDRIDDYNINKIVD